MTRPVRVGVQLWPGGAPDYRSWRAAAVQPEELGADLVFGYDHFDAPAMKAIGGSGEKRTLPAVARHADIWHTFLRIDRFNRASKIVAELATADGRNAPTSNDRRCGRAPGLPTPTATPASPCSPPRSIRPPRLTTSAPWRR